MDKDDPFSENNKIPLDRSLSNRVVYSKINFKFEICSAL